MIAGFRESFFANFVPYLTKAKLCFYPANRERSEYFEMATKKATVSVKAKKASAAKKSTSVKKTESVKKVKKAAVKKVAAKKSATAKSPAKTAVKKVAAKKSPAKTAAKAIEKTADVVTKPIEKKVSKPLSTGQHKKAKAKKKLSEVDALIKDTYTQNPTAPKNTKPVDHAAYELAKTIVDGILEKKGENLVCLDLRNIENRVCDYFIICEGNSTTQIDAIAGSVEFTVKKVLGERPYRSEGWDNALWILIDYVNVIVHVFDRETRAFYNLESLWADADEVKF
jgi:ribosome-associated protein